MDEHSPLDEPEGNWWNRAVNRRETIWLGISGAWAFTLFTWMIGWTEAGGQNQIGPSRKVSTEAFRRRVQSYKESAGAATVGGEQYLVPPGEDVYIGALQWAWDGLPVVLEPERTYRFHLGAYDVQHGLSIRHEDNLSQQLSLQILPGYEWTVEMAFDDPGTYHVVCNEFCGTGHRSMHGKFLVRAREELDDVTEPGTGDGSETGADGSGADGSGGTDADDGGSGPPAYGGWFTDDARGGATANYGGSPTDATGEEGVTVTVGAEGNGGTFAYDPAAVRVSPGTTVAFEWTSNNHNLLLESAPEGGDWGGHEPLENDGFGVEHTFETPGVYKYYCQPHLSLGMKGLVEVV